MNQKTIENWIGKRLVIARNENKDNLVIIVENYADNTYDYLRFFTIGEKTQCSVGGNISTFFSRMVWFEF